MLTVNKIPVPEPIAPKKSAKTVNNPIHIPPKVAAVITNCLIFLYVPSFVFPLINIPCSLRPLAISLGPCPDTSIHVRLNKAQPKL